LGLSKTFTPEELLQLTPSERGRSIHRILENYGQALKQDEILRQTVSAARETMRQAVTDEFAMMSERQIVGHDAFWKLDRSHIEGLLLAFVEKDFEVRETYQSHITAVEETFGTPEPVKIELGKRVLDVRGQIDRIDVIDATNATKRRIYDYKTGKKVEMKTVDTFTGGVRLQLPLYALAMRRSPDELVEAAYWNFDGKPITKVLALTTHTEERLVEVIDTLASGIEEGIFPVYPGGSERGSNYDNCLFCDFDSICPKDRSNEWQRVSETSRLSSFRALKGTAAEVTGEVEE
jgi:ATP-dependent helicase/DNAse subunit B